MCPIWALPDFSYNLLQVLGLRTHHPSMPPIDLQSKSMYINTGETMAAGLQMGATIILYPSPAKVLLEERRGGNPTAQTANCKVA